MKSVCLSSSVQVITVITVVVLQIFGSCLALPVIHNTLTRVHDSKIYFHNAVNPWGKRLSEEQEPNPTKYRNNFFNFGNGIPSDDYNNMDERIYFPVPEPGTEEFNTRQLISDTGDTDEQYGDSEAILFEQDVPQIQLRHALAATEIYDMTPTTTESPEEVKPTPGTTPMTTTKAPEIEKELDEFNKEHKQVDIRTHSPVPLSFLEEWAKRHSASSSERADGAIQMPVDESPMIFEDGDKENGGQDKSFSFQSFLQIPRLSSSNARSSEGCPPNQFRNHRGKCVKPVRIIVFETEDADES